MLRTHFKLIAIICLISSLARFALDSYLPSLPAIQSQFSLTNAATQWTLTDYLLGFSLSQLIYGPLSDRYGRRRIMLSGMSIFFFGSLICSLASSPMILFFSRFIAGVGAGACGVLNRAIASDSFKGAEFSRAWSYTTTTLVLTLVFAPVLGGFVQDYFGWRGNFILATGFVAMVSLLAWQFLPETLHVHLPASSFTFRRVMADYQRILFSRSFLLGTLCYTFAFSGLILYFQLSPLLYMNVMGLTSIQYGWSSLVIAFSYLIGGFIVNYFSRYLSLSSLIVLGACLLMSGGVLMVIGNCLKHVEVICILLPASIYVIGARIIIPNAIASSMKEFRHANGSSSALIGCIQMLGSSLISLLMTACDNQSAIPLGVFFCLLGVVTFLLTFYLPEQQTVCS